MSVPPCESSGVYTISVYDTEEFKQRDSRDFSSRRELAGSVDTIDENAKAENFWDSEIWGGCKMRSFVCFVADIVIIVATIICILAIEVNWLPSKKGGFFCNDPKLTHKFRGDTISNTILLSVSFGTPLIHFFMCEFIAFIPDLYQTSSTSRRIHISVKRTIYRYREYLIGLAILLTTIEIGKGVFGEPRPHFFDSCKPDTAIGCNDSAFIETYTCTNTELSSINVQDSHKSFPSGHSALSAYSGLFFAWYMEKRFPKRLDSWLIKPFLQLIFFLWAFCVPITRITDHRHHWWDALAGTTLGLICLAYTVRTFCDNFDNPEYKSHDKNHQSIKRLISTTSEATRTDKELTNVNSYK